MTWQTRFAFVKDRDEAYIRPAKQVVRNDRSVAPIIGSSKLSLSFWIAAVPLAALVATCIVFLSPYLGGWQDPKERRTVVAPRDERVGLFVSFEKRFVAPWDGCEGCGGSDTDTGGDVDIKIISERARMWPWLFKVQPSAKELGLIEELHRR